MKKILLFLLFLTAADFSQAQRAEFKQQVGFGLSASTNGLGGNLYWRPMKRISVKLAHEQMSFGVKYEIDESDLKLDSRFDYKTGATSLTAGFQMCPGIYLVAGIANFRFGPEIKGIPQSEVEFGDITLSPETVGDLSIKIKPGNEIAPYAALGFGNTVPWRHGFSFGVEFGTYYMNAPRFDIHTSGMLTPTMDPDHVASLEREFEQFRFYPVLKFNFSFKIFTFNK